MNQVVVFEPTLVNEQSAEGIADQLRAVFYGKTIEVKITTWRGEVERLQGELFDNGIRVSLASERNHLTTSTLISWVFKQFACHFDSNDDVLVEWLSENCVRFTNKRKPRVDARSHFTGEPEKEIIFSVLAT